MPTEAYTISEDLQYELQRFFNAHDITLLKENLRRLLIDFLDYELRTGVPLYLDGFLYPFNALLDVLEQAGREVDVFAQKHQQQQQQAATAQEKVLQFIKATLSPEKVFLLHEITSDDRTTCFDLLVVIPETSKTGFTYYEQVLSMATIEGVELHVSLHKSVMLQRQLQEGHIYYSLHCTKDKLVYDDGRFALPEPNSAALAALKDTASNVFITAYKKAESFLQGAARYIQEHDRPMAAFMLQQSLELCLRGLITALLGSCPKTHCFKDLKRQLRRCAPELLTLFSTDEAEENRLLHILEKAYLDARYTNTLVITAGDIALLHDGAQRFLVKAKEVFEGKMEGLVRWS